MKKNYHIVNNIDSLNKFIYVYNYKFTNELLNIGLDNLDGEMINQYCVGVWSIKHK